MIYFAQQVHGGPIKIGHAATPVLRRTQLNSMFPLGVELLATMEGDYFVEAFLHLAFRPVAVSQEWFRSCSAVWRAILAIEDDGALDFIPADGGRGTDFAHVALREFGSKEAAIEACGYSPFTTFDYTFGPQSRGGARARLAFAIALRDGVLPPHISGLHADGKAAAA